MTFRIKTSIRTQLQELLDKNQEYRFLIFNDKYEDHYEIYGFNRSLRWWNWLFYRPEKAVAFQESGERDYKVVTSSEIMARVLYDSLVDSKFEVVLVR